MLRAGVVILAALVIAVFALLHWNALGSALGIVIGAVFFAIALGRNNGLVNASLRKDPARPNDPNAGISMGLAAAGIALGAMSNPHYPVLFHRFYVFCLAAGLVIAATLALRHAKPRPEQKVDAPASDKNARPEKSALD